MFQCKQPAESFPSGTQTELSLWWRCHLIRAMGSGAAPQAQRSALHSPTRINPGKYHIPGSHSAFFQTSMMNCTCSARGRIEHVMLHLLRGHASYYTCVSRTTRELFNWLHTCVLHHTCSCSLPSRILHLLITRLSKRKRRGLADAVIDFCPPHFLHLSVRSGCLCTPI